jgi:oxygen-independent coproporphyrinogen-3 oxidase
MTSQTKALVDTKLSLYVHVPFCETKCPYCDFNTYARIESLMEPYVAALCTEIRLWGRLLSRPALHTVFLGGGTPSYLPSRLIAAIMDTVREAFALEVDAEVTMEANPGDFDEIDLAAHLAAGINRISIGVQSMDDGLLTMLGRRHTADDAVRAYRAAIDAGLGNVSLDLMYGLPHQTLAQWEDTLARVLALDPPHLSMYGLTLEGGTPMERWVEDGSMPEPDPDLAADMYIHAQDVMQCRGYRHYEISNWAIPGFESRHNLTYWRNAPYLGVGPGAHSYLMGHRFFNIKPPREYIQRLAKMPSPQSSPRTGEEGRARALIASVPVVEDVEQIGHRLEMAETLMMGLRLDSGISLAGFAERFGEPVTHAYGDTIADLTTLGLLETTADALRLTPRGLLLGNEVFARFFE